MIGLDIEVRKPWQFREVLIESEAADYLRVEVATLRRWRRVGGGPAFVKSAPGKSGRVTYRVDSLREWTQSKERFAT